MPFRNILLIDDDTEDHELFKIALDQVSKTAECTTSTNAREALNMLVTKQLNPDVIFLDLNMPIMSGLEFLKEVKMRSETQYIPIIIFSTSSNAATVKLTRDMGAVDFITKPDRFDKLVEILKRIITD